MPRVENSAHPTEAEAERDRVDELTKRIELISALDEDELGGWTRLDWVFITILGIVGPLLVLYGFAP